MGGLRYRTVTFGWIAHKSPLKPADTARTERPEHQS
jgi:hypothetical protein